jgi:hypothetical protein
MSEEDRCRNGNPDCEFDDKHEQALARKLMRVIASYSKKEGIDICPLCLRDTMLAVAALLHLEAARIDSESRNRPPPRAKKLGDTLAKAARNALQDVSSAKAALVSSRGRH